VLTVYYMSGYVRSCVGSERLNEVRYVDIAACSVRGSVWCTRVSTTDKNMMCSLAQVRTFSAFWCISHKYVLLARVCAFGTSAYFWHKRVLLARVCAFGT